MTVLNARPVLDLWVDNDTVAELQSLTNTTKGDFENAGTVTLTIKQPDDTDLPGTVWPVTLPPVGVGGDYSLILTNMDQLTADTVYTAVYDATDIGGNTAHWELDVTARDRIY